MSTLKSRHSPASSHDEEDFAASTFVDVLITNGPSYQQSSQSLAPRCPSPSSSSSTSVSVSSGNDSSQYDEESSTEFDHDCKKENAVPLLKHNSNFSHHQHQQQSQNLRQRIFHHASNVFVGVLIIATVVSNVRAITLAIVSNWRRNTQRRNNMNKWESDAYNVSSSTHQPTLLLTRSGCAKSLVALFILMSAPWLFWTCLPTQADSSIFLFAQEIIVVWDSLLHISTTPIVFIACFLSCWKLAPLHYSSSSPSSGPTLNSTYNKLYTKTLVGIVLCFFCCTIVGSQLQIISPSWIWNPFLLGHWTVYTPNEIVQKHLPNLCLEKTNTQDTKFQRRPDLCLTRNDWNALGGKVLSPDNPTDVEAVHRGLDYAEEHGVIVNVMARDTIDAIPALRENVFSLVPFFQKVAVVIFENDSKDGTRQAFEAWANEVNDKTGSKIFVDLISCGPSNPNCQFGLSHRYDSTESKEYFTSSAIGKMAEFRQKIVDYIMQQPAYTSPESIYSHMLVIDLDLQVTFSPLGVLHSLGALPHDVAVASTGRQVWPGSMGTLTPPYDFSAYRSKPDKYNSKLMYLHQKFCGILPEGDRWRNQCDAVSPMHLIQILQHDRFDTEEPFEVESAFNGATLYPIDLIRRTNAKYDAGSDGQRCEHIAFNTGLQKLMYVNPKWTFRIAPENPGGPTGIRALKNVVRIVFTPELSSVIGVQNAVCMVTFVLCIMSLSINFLYPLLAFLFKLTVWLVSTVFGVNLTRRNKTDPSCSFSSSISLPITAAPIPAGKDSMLGACPCCVENSESTAAAIRMPLLHSFSSTSSSTSRATKCV